MIDHSLVQEHYAEQCIDLQMPLAIDQREYILHREYSELALLMLKLESCL